MPRLLFRFTPVLSILLLVLLVLCGATPRAPGRTVK